MLKAWLKSRLITPTALAVDAEPPVLLLEVSWVVQHGLPLIHGHLLILQET